MKKLFIFSLIVGIAVMLVAIFRFNPIANATQVSDNCDHSCPVIHFEWQTTSYDNCPQGYSVQNGHEDKCRQNASPHAIINRPSHQVNHEADVAYNKSEDPNKCHRPSDNTLDDVYGMDHDARQDFKDAHPEWLDSEDITPEGYYNEDGVCYQKTEVCADDSALNYGGEDGKFDSEKEVANNDLCQYPEPPADQCSNLSGIQEDVPTNMDTNSDHICSCKDGYHQVPVDNEEYLLDKIIEQDFTCEPNEPTPPNNPPSNPPTSSSVSTPVCTDGNTVELPANPHVIRLEDKSKATVNFFITQGDSANIYYRVVGQSSWQYSVLDIKPNGEKFVSYTVNDLDPNLGYEFGIQQKYGCGGGQLVTAVIVDGPKAETFGFSYWEWSK